jgi:hypothetical protein
MHVEGLHEAYGEPRLELGQGCIGSLLLSLPENQQDDHQNGQGRHDSSDAEGEIALMGAHRGNAKNCGKDRERER